MSEEKKNPSYPIGTTEPVPLPIIAVIAIMIAIFAIILALAHYLRR